MSHWKDKTALVTGAASGIGKALALAMAERGARVVVTDINAEAARAVAEQCGPGSSGHALDVRDAAAVRDRVHELVSNHGRIDFLFNNAGIGIGGETHELAVEHWDRIIDINVRGVVHGVVAAYPIMVKQRSGHIINTASLAGLTPVPLLTPYATTKHAVVGLTTSLRTEAEPHGVRVSALCPAAIETPLLDTKEHPGLATPPWIPDARRYLTSAAGAPYPLAKFTAEALAGIEKNRGLIVIPGRARAVWRATRMFPGLVERIGKGLVRDERASRT